MLLMSQSVCVCVCVCVGGGKPEEKVLLRGCCFIAQENLSFLKYINFISNVSHEIPYGKSK